MDFYYTQNKYKMNNRLDKIRTTRQIEIQSSIHYIHIFIASSHEQ